MQTQLSTEFRQSVDAHDAEAVLRKCVHCGFCLATCPTYQLLGDERDSPRGRIYLIKQVLEGQAPSRQTQLHLDRCLTCRNCETTCPSGVEYGRLVEIGRYVVERKLRRPPGAALLRKLLAFGLTSPAFGPAVRLGRWLRPILPRALREKLPPVRRTGPVRTWPARQHATRMLLLRGCVQPALLPDIHPATARVLDRIGIELVVAPAAGCCGAIRAHLGEREAALHQMRRNIDAWWPIIEGRDGGVAASAIVTDASGCGAMLKDYGAMLEHDAAYCAKAARVSAMARDVAEVLSERLSELEKLRARLAGARPALAVHIPCTLQHGQRQPEVLLRILAALGLDAATTSQENHLCCGSAGTYSILQPELARRLRDRKLRHLRALRRPLIVSANVGCIQHLQSGTQLPVRHWIEVVDDLLAQGD